MQVIGFFAGLFQGLGSVVGFVNTPFSELVDSKVLKSIPLGQLSIMQMFGIGLFATLAIFLAIRLFQLVNPF